MKERRDHSLGRTIAAGLLLGVAAYYYRDRYMKPRYSFAGRVVLITGGSRGLGLVLARHWVRAGARVALLARNLEELERASFDLKGHGGDPLIIQCDLRQPEQIRQSISRVIGTMGAIDILVNNAGIIQVGPLEHMTLEDFEEAMAIHFYAPLVANLQVIPHMRQRGGGRIINIASIGGRLALPHLAPYTASKFALAGLSDALRTEVRRDNIYVTTVCPSLLRTGSAPNAQFKGKHELEYAWFSVSSNLPLFSMDPDHAARQILDACQRGKPTLNLSIPAKTAIALNALFPDAAARLTCLVDRILPAMEAEGSNRAHSGWKSRPRWLPSWATTAMDTAADRNNERTGNGS